MFIKAKYKLKDIVLKSNDIRTILFLSPYFFLKRIAIILLSLNAMGIVQKREIKKKIPFAFYSCNYVHTSRLGDVLRHNFVGSLEKFIISNIFLGG